MGEPANHREYRSRKALLVFKLKSEDVQDVPANAGFHRECYMVVTNIEHIERERKKREKAANSSEGLYQIINFFQILYDRGQSV